MTQDMKMLNKFLFAIRQLLLMVMLTVGVGGLWGQVTIQNGAYFIASYSGYSSTTPSNNYYLCPAGDGYITYDSPFTNMPYLTTYKTGQVSGSIWIITHVETVNPKIRN